MYTPFKMKGKSPLMKKLIGNQHRLPAELKAKIEAAPESPTKMMKKSPTKMAKKSPTKKVNPFSAEYKRMTPSQRKKKYGFKTTKEGIEEKKIIGSDKKGTIKGALNQLDKVISPGEKKHISVKNIIKGKGKVVKSGPSPSNTTKKKPTTSTNDTTKKKSGPDWKTAPAVGTKKRTEWYKKHNLKLDDTTPALMKKAAMKLKKKSPTKMMKKSPSKMAKKSPAQKYKSDAQRKAVHASKADGGKGAPAKMMKKSAAKMMKKSVAKLKKKTKGESLKKAVVGKTKKSTAREKRINRNKEFGPIAIKKGLAPKKPKAGDLSPKGRAELKAYEKFYSNKENLKKLKKAQEEYFKNKK